ncbi:hypothetical protein D5S17_00405 [Pseudonocardiaceae bacterium YIM PH 21723]|nr:hypothetical protein D5S17_00405 [Pseudonocardiaceae bacterium YIM PH 21723]
MTRWLVPLLALALTGCGVNNTEVIGMGDAAKGVKAGPIVYLLKGGKPTAVDRPGLKRRGSDLAMLALLRPLSAQEQAAGYTTEVPTFSEVKPGDVFIDESATPLTVEVYLPLPKNYRFSATARQQVACTLRAAKAYKAESVRMKISGIPGEASSCPL